MRASAVVCVCLLVVMSAAVTVTARSHLRRRTHDGNTKLTAPLHMRANPTDPDEVEYQVAVNGTLRTYYVYVPASYTGLTAFPLVVFFHGMTDSCSRGTNFMIAGFTREQRLGRQFLLASGCGLNHAWSMAGDVPFVETILDAVAAAYNVDPNRLYSAGFSNGAGLTEYMGCHIPQRWTGGLAIAAGSVLFGSTQANAQLLETCDSLFAQANVKLNVFKLQGTADTAVVPYGATGVVSMRDDFYGWALRNGCKGSPTTYHEDRVYKDERFDDCPDGVRVRLVTMNGIPHQWVQNSTFNYNTAILDHYGIPAPTDTAPATA